MATLEGSFTLLRSTRGSRVLALKPCLSEHEGIAILFTPTKHDESERSSLAVSVVPVDVVDSYAFKPISPCKFHGVIGVIRVQHGIFLLYLHLRKFPRSYWRQSDGRLYWRRFDIPDQ